MAALTLIVGLPCFLVGVWIVGRLAGDVVRWLKHGAGDPDAPPVYGFPVIARPALPVRDGEDGPGRYRVAGAAFTVADVTLHVDAATLANAKVKAELRGVIVTAVEKGQ